MSGEGHEDNQTARRRAEGITARAALEVSTCCGDSVAASLDIERAIETVNTAESDAEVEHQYCQSRTETDATPTINILATIARVMISSDADKRDED